MKSGIFQVVKYHTDGTLPNQAIGTGFRIANIKLFATNNQIFQHYEAAKITTSHAIRFKDFLTWFPKNTLYNVFSVTSVPT